MSGVRGRPADQMHRRISYMLMALARKSRGMTRQSLMAVAGLDESSDSQRRKFERDLWAIRKSGWSVDREYRHDQDLGQRDWYVLRVVDHRLRAGFTDVERSQLLRAAERAGLGQLYEDLGAPSDGKELTDPTEADLVQIQHAIHIRSRLRFTYSQKSRSVHPYDVFYRRSRWYFRGRENFSPAVKTWKLERVADLILGQPGSAEGIPALPEPNLDPMLQENHEARTAVVRVDRIYLDEVISMLGSQGHEAPSSGDPDATSVDVTFSVTHQEAFLNRLFELRERVVLVGPEPLRETARDTLTSIASNSSQRTGGPAGRDVSDRQRSVPPALIPNHPTARVEPVVGSGPGGLLLPEIAHFLQRTGGKASVSVLAAALGRDTEVIRRHLAVLEDTEFLDRLEQQDPDFYHPPLWIDPCGDEPSNEDEVRLESQDDEFLGTESFDASVLGPLYVAAEQLSVEEPENEELARAADKLQKRFLPAFREGPRFGSEVARGLAIAIRDRRAVRIVYARAWEPGVSERTIHPYRLEATSRGVEIDAEPAENPGQARTFLIGNIRELRQLPERFELPADFEVVCQRNRETKLVEGMVPLSRQWAIEKWAERVSFGYSQDGEIEFEAELLQPFKERIALMMITAGPGADLFGSEEEEELAPALARELLELHGL